ncbi:MAG: alpha/beta hydrolase [Candidatus Nealsonbacteria bacterium]|nr:alpha/beta hydrolase [Candidatus Nealsonbacteria bacterium]
MRFEKLSVVINKRKTFYWQKNNSQKEAIVLLHGFPGNHEGLVDMANGLGNYRLIIPDFPACGQSESLNEKYSLENYAKWLNTFFEGLSINKAIVIGHSFGSRVALVFTSRYPEKVNKLALITPVVKVEGLISRVVAIEYKIAELLPKKLRRLWLSNQIHRKVSDIVLFKSASPKRRQEITAKDRRERKNFNPQINLELFSEFYRYSLVPIGKKIKTESLVIASDMDSIAPLNSVKELAEQLANVKFTVMKHSGHIVVLERPLATANIIRHWLEKA